MSVATLAAFAIGDLAEAVGVCSFTGWGSSLRISLWRGAVPRSWTQWIWRPEVVSLAGEDGVRVIPAKEASVGDILLVRPGDRIPLDGVVTEGESRIDHVPVTGEPVRWRAAGIRGDLRLRK